MANSAKGYSLMSSIVSARCPRCREGKLYSSAMFSRKSLNMNSQCSCCGQSFVFEPGFFLGSAFFSYFLYGVLLSATALIWFYFTPEVPMVTIMVLLLVAVLALAPAMLRLSKSIWIHIFVRYEGPCGSIPRKD